MHPVLFKMGDVAVYSYGFFVAMGMLAAFCLVVSSAARFGFSRDAVSDLVFLLFVTGVIGARFFYVLQHFEEYGSAPMKVFSVQQGGLVWYGGFMFAATSGLIYALRRRLPVLKLLDFFAPLVPLSHAIGRIGCFLNGCCFGHFTESGWGVLLPGEGAPRLPVQIYESAFLLLLSLFLFVLSSKKHRDGEIFMGYVAGYGAGRFLLEFLRGDQILIFFLTIPQWTSVFLLAAALALFIFSRIIHGKNPF
ncbi:MAG: prolipoprotein diacylglyceryl transferase [Omnitrophica bacterium RIFCSPHIGHO2_02_FULL_51_18]|nr:MAG: prolipoprotein diacylglyceryl transferase [Omnitrophica bacterium RIFCSPHIGHO2_02_FULL_51_18]